MDALLPLSPASPGGQIEDVEELSGAGGVTVVRQRVQVAGAVLEEIARVLKVDPTSADFALAIRAIFPTVANPVTTRVAASMVSVTLLAANPLRRGAMFFHEGATAALMYLFLGTPATTTLYTVRLYPNAYYELPQPIYTGEITAIWDDAAGAVLVTET